jgi:hypothetical protein
MLHHIATISVCYGGHFESKMTAKIQKSSADLGEIWYYYRHSCNNVAPVTNLCLGTLRVSEHLEFYY